MFQRMIRSVFGLADGDAAPRPRNAAATADPSGNARLDDIFSVPSLPLRAMFEDRYHRELPDRQLLAQQVAAAHAAAFDGDPLPLAVELLVRAPIMRMLLRQNTDGMRRLGVAFDNALEFGRNKSFGYHRGTLPIPPHRLPLVLQSLGLMVAQGMHEIHWGPGQWLMPVVRAAAERGDPATRAQLVEMFSTFFKGEAFRHDAALRMVEKLLPDSGLPRTAIPELVAADARTAKLDAIRARVLAAAGEPLGTAIADVLDRSGHAFSRSIRDSEQVPAIRAVYDQSPEARGASFRRLLTLIVDLPSFGLTHWGELERPNGRYEKVVQPSKHLFGLGTILGGLATRKIALPRPDDDIADFLAMLPHFHHLDHKRILDLVLATARDHPHGRTVAALRKMLEPAHSNHAFRERRIAIEDVLRNLPAAAPAAAVTPAAPAAGAPRAFATPGGFGRKGLTPAAAPVQPAALHGLPPIALPEIDLGRWGAEQRIGDHFDNLFEPRLHDAKHRDYLARLAALRDELAALRERPARERNPIILDLIRAEGFTVASDLALVVVDRAVETGVELQQRFAAFAPFVANHPEESRAISGLAVELGDRATPAAKWLEAGRKLVGAIPAEQRLAMIAAMIAAPTPTATVPANERHLRTLILLSSDLDPAAIGPALTDFALRRCYVTLPNVGIRAEKLGNACVWALAAIPDGGGVPYLARILARTKYPKIKAKIDAKLNEAAAAAGMSRATLDELTVPTHDLDRDGTRRFALGDGEAVLRIAATRGAEIEWIAGSGKTLKSPSQAMKADGEALKAVRQAAKELEADLAIQPARLQRLYLDDRRLSAEDWRERTLEHPLMRSFARRLIWWVEAADGSRHAGLPDADGTGLCDVSGRPLALDGATIRLWHPIEASPAEVSEWRERLEALEMVQPFAQAWREVYALTDAERTTGTYSNRWAAHILKQHQAMTLARINGWRVTHRMWVDAANDQPWHLAIANHGLVADYWIQGAGGDTPEVADSGAYAYVLTDRVQFHRIATDATDSATGPDRGEAVPLTEIPPIVFSEVMRHADLFTSVASIAADPNWLDRGADAAHPSQWDRHAQAYWTQTNTGNLEESGKRRRELLERIVPRLRIADKLAFDDRHLLVQGKRHRYRIHLGSGASFSEERHICIVPAATGEGGRLWLPFEGDRTLSIIISKAMLLAADDKITDPVILGQL